MAGAPRPTHYLPPHTLASVPQASPDPVQLTRRRLLGLALSGASSALLTACSGGIPIPGREQAVCVPRDRLERHTALAGLPLVYEVSRRRNAFWFDPGFAAQLGTWLTDVREAGLEADELWTYGAWTDGSDQCRSWHNSGRAFDVARVRVPDGFVSCRYDQWRTTTGAELRRALRDYWALAASLHGHFAYVVTYLYDTEHHNHIHVDNGRSGTGRSEFDPGSITQVQAIQAIASYVWGRPTDITGRWDGPTRDATRAILAEIGPDADLTDEGAWSRFCSASISSP